MFIIGIVFSCNLLAQNNPAKESEAYHKYRVHLSYPPYGFDKVNTLIKKQVVTDSEDNLVLRDKAYSSLSFREKFTYNMLHAEAFSQNCEAMPIVKEERNKIFAYLPDAFDEYAWSERQDSFFMNNRDSVIALIEECSSKNNRVGINFKQAIFEMKASEMIPFLVKIYKVERKDYDILTLLMMLMEEAQYKDFLASTSYKKLYGEDANYQDLHYI